MIINIGMMKGLGMDGAAGSMRRDQLGRDAAASQDRERAKHEQSKHEQSNREGSENEQVNDEEVNQYEQRDEGDSTVPFSDRSSPPPVRHNNWLRGAALLGGAALFCKVLGTVQKVPLQNLAGDRVFGIYNAVYPFYQLLLYLTTAGFPVAVSLLVAERRQAGDVRGMRLAAVMGALLLGIAGLVGFVLMWSAADWTAAFIGDKDASQSIRAAALALWVVPAAGALRGYFQGLQQMAPSALSQVSEQLVRVAVMLSLLFAGLAAGWSPAGLAAGAMAGSAAGGFAGLIVMLLFWRREMQRHSVVVPAGSATADKTGLASRKSTARNLVKLALPVAVGSLAVPIAGLVDAFTVPRLLGASGMSGSEAMTQFGLYSRGQPLVQLVVMVAGTAASALVPLLVAARAAGSRLQIEASGELAMRLAWWIGAAASLGLALLAGPVNVMLYADNQQALTFTLIGCTALAGTLNAVSTALLQGLGAVRAPAAFLLIAALLKVLLNAALVPLLGIAGAAYAGIAAFAAAALLGVAAVRRTAGVRLPAPRIAAGTIAALAAMAVTLLLLQHGMAALLGSWPLPERAAATVHALAGTAIGAAVFGAVLLRCGGISARELSGLPGGGALASRLRRLRLLPAERGQEV
ncbi:polysaccharide biosynthesis protein [Paenibacillaceae bacterium]|nr:polysaccharide biosynthesis protein [Paenibacillaceae bacterium]